MSLPPATNSTGRLFAAIAMVVMGTVLSATFFQQCLSSKILSSNFVHPLTWLAITQASPLSKSAQPIPESIDVSYSFVWIPCVAVALVVWVGGAAWLVWRRGDDWTKAFINWGWYGWLWWCVLDVWEWLWIATGMTGWTSFASLLAVTPQLWLAGCLACWLTTFGVLAETNLASDLRPPAFRRSSWWLWIAIGIYVLVFTTMNWRLYDNLLVPHGDSVMYEEHLWNLLHGKGFRSYLDQGLFLGEHIQFVHLFLLPLYILWPSHLLLEACSSTALALGAFPVYWMVRRQTADDRTALACAVGYLLYFPMQFLDIEIDLKTFRPESFGIPLLLLTLDQLDRKRVLGTLIGVGFCLTVKEDYAIILGPLGVWIAFSSARATSTSTNLSQRTTMFDNFRTRFLFGMSLSVFSVGYLWLATRVVMPWFRSGVEVHYASYFAKLGKSPEEIIKTIVFRPGFVASELITVETLLYAIALLAPLAFLPLLAPGRLAVGAPLFGILCLNELERSRTPQHQFHAPLVAILFWSLAAAIPRAEIFLRKSVQRWTFTKSSPGQNSSAIIRNLVWTSALTTGVFFSLSPLGITFWDTESSWYWRRLYGPSQRPVMFARINASIPKSARVASTDFVHPRFTHHERSYDYSNYQRKVSGEGNRVPDDTDYVVIDTNHRYSQVKSPDQVAELRDHSDRWELLPDQTEGYFIVLKRKKKDTE